MCIQPQTRAHIDSGGLNEAVLAAVWNEQAPLRGPMWDCDGQPVAVVYRGRWTAGSGPDFEGAILNIGEGPGSLVNGAVEIHLRCADWWAHGHHTDPRYNSVALHVVLWPAAARPVTRQDGAQVPTLVLADYITLPAAELVERARPLVQNLGTLSEEPCWQRTQSWPIEKILGIIEEAGNTRFAARAATIEADLSVLDSPDEAFYRGLMDSMGYSANREPMRQVASALPVSALVALPLTSKAEERALLLEAILLGAGGLLPSQRAELGNLDYLNAEYANELENIWQTHAPALGLYGASASGWSADRVRPANSAPRRLAAAARLLAGLLWEPGGMLGPFLSIAHLPAPELARRWTRLLEVPAEGYWAFRSDFGVPLANAPEGVALLGESRARDMAVNILLPLLAAQAERSATPGLREKALAVYAAFPSLAENHITKAMAEETLGPRKKGAITGARRQQGLIHLYRLYCQPRRCYECPLSGVMSFE